MNFSVLNNTAANATLTNLANTQNKMQDAVAKLSSGLRINKAADDAAGLAISQGMQAQVNGLNQANQNAQDGVSLIQTAEGGMGQIQNILQRMRTLAVQSASDTTSSSQRTDIQTEVNQLASQITDISNQTQFNGLNVLSGAADSGYAGADANAGASLTFQVGANAGENLQVNIHAVDAFSLNVATGAQANVAGGQIIAGGKATVTAGIDVSTTQATASSAITTIDTAINNVSTYRANLGAYQNRLNYTMSNVQTESQNLNSAMSNITNVNMAQEMSNFTQLNVLQQAGASILSQANQMPQAILKMLQ